MRMCTFTFTHLFISGHFNKGFDTTSVNTAVTPAPSFLKSINRDSNSFISSSSPNPKKCTPSGFNSKRLSN